MNGLKYIPLQSNDYRYDGDLLLAGGSAHKHWWPDNSHKGGSWGYKKIEMHSVHPCDVMNGNTKNGLSAFPNWSTNILSMMTF